MTKRPITPGYVFFYLLFSPDTWRILTGVVLACLLAPPIIATREMNTMAKVVMWIMVGGIGYGFSGMPAKKFSAFLRRRILGDRR